MMTTLLFIAGACWLLTGLIHAVLGGRVILRPALTRLTAVDARPTLVGETLRVGWHLLTWQFVTIGLGFALVGTIAPELGRALAAASLALAVGYAAVFLVVGFRVFRVPWRMPQWVLFLTIAAVSAAVLTGGLESGNSSLAGAPARVAATAAALAMAAIALLHVGWALGSSFPAKDRASLLDHVVGAPLVSGRARAPSTLATLAVAALLFVGAGLVAVVPNIERVTSASGLVRGLAGGVAAVFAARGVLGFFEPALRPAIVKTPYWSWSRRLYSPLSLAIAISISLALLWGA
ncbi:MAG: DUF3995 domain-containing protein [Polyangiaceae bacterium]